MKKFIFFSAALAVSLLSSCDDEDRLETDTLNEGPKIVGFQEDFSQVAYFENIGSVEHKFPVVLYGLGNGDLPSSDIDVYYEVDPASTATEGVEFNFLDTSGKITIPAGNTFAEFPLSVNTGQLNPTSKTELILKLTSASSGSVVGYQYQTLKIVFVGCQSALEGVYTVVVTRNDGIIRTYFNETVTEVGTNYFKTNTTGTWAAGTIAPDQGYNFTDVCGEITISQQGICQGYYSNQVFGFAANDIDGTVTDSDHFQTNYEITFAAGNRQFNNAYTRD